MAKSMEAGAVREAIVGLLKQNPEGLRVQQLAESILGATTNEDQRRARAARISFALRGLVDAKHIKKGPLNTSPYFLADGRPEPVVHDLPANGNGARRGRTPGSKNKPKNGEAVGLRLYIIRDIKTKLAELEALE